MPPPGPTVLFSLKPLNSRAQAVVAHSRNSHLVSTLPDGTRALDIGFHINSSPNITLATLGRQKTDIFIDISSIARLQCSFEINIDSKVVLLYDRSNGETTQVSGDNATPFEYGRLRRVVVQKGLNSILGMGGVRCNLVQFQLHWHYPPGETADEIQKHEKMLCEVEDPRLARTVDEEPEILSSQRLTRPYTARDRKPTMRYVKVGDPLGSGEFGTVYKCIDVDSGKFMAVKIITWDAEIPVDERERRVRHALKREVEIIYSVRHKHIVDFITFQYWDALVGAEIFMGLKDGSLDSLVRSGGNTPTIDGWSVEETVFRQMLEALDCLAFNGIVHRDVKPQNILYTLQPDGKLQFQLGDFGLCNRTAKAVTEAGTPIFMAPEIMHGQQSSKLDVWSLFVTMLWTLGVPRFRLGHFESNKHLWDEVLDAAQNFKKVSQIRDMAIVNVDERASAAQMLVKEFNSSGLTTPLTCVPSLASRPFPAIACAEDLARIMTPIQPSVTQDKPVVDRKNKKVSSSVQSTRTSPRNARKENNPLARSTGRKQSNAPKERNITPKSSSRQKPYTNYSREMDVSP